MDTDKIKIIDDCISVNYQNFLLQELQATNLVWSFTSDVTTYSKDIKNINPGFSNTPYQNNAISSTAYWFLYPTLLEACNKINYKVEKLLRIRIGIYVNRYIDKPNMPHVDDSNPHLVGLYYPDDYDGDTVFYTDSTGQTELTRVTPKKGRMVLFDGSIYHASSNPVKSNHRMTVNFNFLGGLS
jgi:hypothetical protein